MWINSNVPFNMEWRYTFLPFRKVYIYYWCCFILVNSFKYSWFCKNSGLLLLPQISCIVSKLLSVVFLGTRVEPQTFSLIKTLFSQLHGVWTYKSYYSEIDVQLLYNFCYYYHSFKSFQTPWHTEYRLKWIRTGSFSGSLNTSLNISKY